MVAFGHIEQHELMPSGRETFCEVLFIKNATATSMYQKVIRQSLYKMARHIGRLPKMAVTTNCKQFFPLKSTVLQHLQQIYRSPKIKHLFSFQISREAQKKTTVSSVQNSKQYTIMECSMLKIKSLNQFSSLYI